MDSQDSLEDMKKEAKNAFKKYSNSHPNKITYEEFRNDVDYLYGDDFAKSAIDVFATKNVRTEVNELEKENDALGFATTCVGGAAGLLFGAAAVSSAIEKTRSDKAELVKTVHDDYTM